MLEAWDRWYVVDYYEGLGGETGGAYYLIVVFFTYAFVFCSLISSVSFLTD